MVTKIDWALNGCIMLTPQRKTVVQKGYNSLFVDDGINIKKISNVERDSIAKRNEKIWGNMMIGNDTPTNQWTTKLGEQLVYDMLVINGENVTRPKKISGCKPDWETDYAIWEVKTRTWTTTGTAGEKVFGVPYKYSDVPKLYNKPLKIVCVAYQRMELTYGNTKIFGEVSSQKKKF